MNLYDYIYVDLDKIISLYSQLTGGVVEIQESVSEIGKTSDNKRKYDFKVFKHDAGGTEHGKESSKFTIKPHHALLQELEQELYNSGHLMNLSSLKEGKTLKDEQTRKDLKNAICIKCTGRIVIEDYERIKFIGSVFPDIASLINKSLEENIKGTPEYKAIEAQLVELESNKGNRNQKHLNKQKANDIRQALDTLLKSRQTVGDVPQWILDGMKTWIDAFLPSITNIRIYPFPDEEDEHIFGNLESTHFTTSNANSFHFTYGSFPTEIFTLIGVVTSVPSDTEDTFDSLEEFDKNDVEDYEKIEKAFRGLFKGFNGLESIIRTCRYPRILVHPLLVYRESRPNKSLQPTA